MTRRAHILVNMAVTADGKIDTVERAGARISGPADSARVDRMRAQADAVLVGGHTLLAEDPRLTVRDPALVEDRRTHRASAQPAKIGVISQLGAPGSTTMLPIDSRFLREGGGRVLIFTTSRTSMVSLGWLRAQGVEVHVLGDERVDLVAMATTLPGLGVERLLVEGGSTIVAALFEAALVDEIQLAIAPIIFGGEGAPTPVGGPGLALADAVRLTLTDATTSIDGDVVTRYVVGTSAA